MRIQKREGWVALAYWVREEWVGGRRWSGHSRPVIPSVIPPCTTPHDETASAGRPTQPDQREPHAAIRHRRPALGRLLIRRLQVRVLPGAQNRRSEAWNAGRRGDAGQPGHSFTVDGGNSATEL